MQKKVILKPEEKWSVDRLKQSWKEKVKGKVVLVLKYYTMKAYGGADV
jgi:hypothetical protein